MTVMRDMEVRAAVEVAHGFGERVNSHSRSSDSMKRALICGVDVIYHCECADAEALDLLEATSIACSSARPSASSTTRSMKRRRSASPGRRRMISACIASSSKTSAPTPRCGKRGVPVVIGGD